MDNKTQKEIDAKIEELKALRDKIKPYSIFGDDNGAKLEAVIKVLEDDLDEDDINDEWDIEDEKLYDINSHAIETAGWRDGESDEDPAEGWPLIN